MTQTKAAPVVASFYKFSRLQDCRELQRSLQLLCADQGLHGTILLAPEGINGTVTGERAGIGRLLQWLRNDPRFADLQHRESTALDMPFRRMKVRLKREIVSMGGEYTNPAKSTGEHVAPADWNRLITTPGILVLDTRNHYESSIGTFTHAIPANTETFREFPDYVDRHLDPHTTPGIAMFCTGGIRCEKASSWLLQNGFKDVYQLQGGILNYLDKTAPGESLWQGECFVFDNRTAINQDLEEGSYVQCYACRRPLSRDDMLSDDYAEGISCPYCIDGLDERQINAFAERHKQVQLAASRNRKHIGADMQKEKTDTPED